MAQKTFVSNTAYDVNGGRCLVDGTGYSIQKGRTLVDGTGYDVAFDNGVEIGSMAVGESVYLNVSGTAYEFLIVHQGNPSTSMYDSSCNGSWLLMKDIYERRQWNSTSGTYSNAYDESSILSYLNSTFLNLLDSNVKTQIKQVKIPYGKGKNTTTVYKGSQGLLTKIFLLSFPEVGFTEDENEYAALDGVKLDYFGSGTGTAAESKRVAYMSGTATNWWLRSPYKSTNYAMHIYSDGSDGRSNCNSSYGIRPALVLPSTALFGSNSHEFVG